MPIPFTKAHGAGNDFLLTRAQDLLHGQDSPSVARAICERHTGVGADGWIIVDGSSIRLFNADGSEAEISGNGTRCAAALLVDAGDAARELDIHTGAGTKHLRLLERDGQQFLFEMDMGQPRWQEQEAAVCGLRATILDVGNPQCAVLTRDIPEDWRELGARIEGDPRFPKRTNVSFVRAVDEHTIEARFYERGAGATLSSGTGSTGAAVAAIVRGIAKSPVRIITQAGDLTLRWDESVYLTGPATLIGRGEFYME
jgi:diaminopimelate epimerase